MSTEFFPNFPGKCRFQYIVSGSSRFPQSNVFAHPKVVFVAFPLNKVSDSSNSILSPITRAEYVV